MEPERENFGCYIFTRMKLADCHENPPGIGICVWNIFLFIWHCCRWVRRFQSGKKDLRNEPRSRAPNTAVNENTIELVTRAIADDPHNMWIQEIPATYYLLHGTIHRIIHDELSMKKLSVKVGTPLIDRGTKMESAELCKTDACHVWTARAQLNDWLMLSMSQEMKLS